MRPCYNEVIYIKIITWEPKHDRVVLKTLCYNEVDLYISITVYSSTHDFITIYYNTCHIKAAFNVVIYVRLGMRMRIIDASRLYCGQIAR